MTSSRIGRQRLRPLYQFGAIDYFIRKRVVALSPSLKNCQAADFLEPLLAASLLRS